MTKQMTAAVLASFIALTAPSCELVRELTSSSNIDVDDFGKLEDGTEIKIYTVTNKNGVRAKLTTYGAILTELHVPDREGKLADVVLGFDTLEGYLAGHPFFGATTGRVANRIAKGKFTLNGTDYQLAVNNGPNHLHGGNVGLDKRVWESEPWTGNAERGVLFSYVSPDKEENYPGTLTIAVKYVLTDEDELRIEYTATTDKATPVNLTHHSYFNLAGAGAETVLDHELKIVAENYTPVDDTLIPTGAIAPVEGTPLDFRTAKVVGARIAELDGPTNGYDHNFVLDNQNGDLALAAVLRDPASGRTMELWTTEPGLQLYTGNFLDGSNVGKGENPYPHRSALCLEAQHYPDSVNRPEFPSTILKPGETYTQTTVHRFIAE